MVICFYSSEIGIEVERRKHPELEHVPVVLTSADNRLVTVSQEARQFGIGPGQSLSGAKTLCPSLCAVAYDQVSYNAAIEPVWNLFAAESSIVEPSSAEVCYLDVPDRDAFERAEIVSMELAAVSLARYRLGVGRSKLVARRAAETGNGLVHVIDSGDEAAFLAPMPVGEALPLDIKTVAILTRLNLNTLGDVLRIALRKFPKELRPIGFRLRTLAIGEDGDPVRPAWPPQAIEQRFAFESEISDEAILRMALKSAASSLAIRLSRRGQITKKLILTLSLAGGCAVTQEQVLPNATADTSALGLAAMRLAARLPCMEGISSLTLSATQLGPGASVQLSLLNARMLGDLYPHEQDRQLEACLSYVRRRFGPTAIRKASHACAPDRRRLWVSPLGVALNDSIQVRTNPDGLPVWYSRHGEAVTVAEVTDRWKEDAGLWGGPTERTRYRVRTAAGGIFELEQSGPSWRLTAAAD